MSTVVKTELAPKPVPLVRATRRPPSATRSARLAALRVPLAAKLVGANIVVVALLLSGWLAAGGPFNHWVAGILVLVVVLHGVLVVVALRPIRDLEDVASRVWRGDFGARVEQSSVADQEVLRVGAMFNILLDGLASDRARMRALAAEVIDVGDRERAALARELHDSTAQRLAALLLQLSAAARDSTDPALAARLAECREAAKEITEEVRLLSHTLHPRVLDDLGLPAALRKLGRDLTAGTGIDVDVEVPADANGLPHGVASVLYRVAQEATTNAVRHATARHIRVLLTVDASAARVEIRDDGHGFDLEEAQRARPGMGLLSMRERLTLVDGWLDIRTAVGGGTSVVGSVPLAPACDANYEEN